MSRKYVSGLMILIFLLSLYQNLKVVTNEVFRWVFTQRYEVEVLSTAQDQWEENGHFLELIEQPSTHLLIDGKPYPFVNDGETDESATEESLYQKYISSSVYIKVYDKKTGKESVTVTQRIDDQDRRTQDDDRFRIIWIEAGNLISEEFTADERRSPIYRAALIANVSSSPIGWVENVLYVWPTLMVPFLFPFTTFGISSIYLLIRLLKNRKR